MANDDPVALAHDAAIVRLLDDDTPTLFAALATLARNVLESVASELTALLAAALDLLLRELGTLQGLFRRLDRGRLPAGALLKPFTAALVTIGRARIIRRCRRACLRRRRGSWRRPHARRCWRTDLRGRGYPGWRRAADLRWRGPPGRLLAGLDALALLAPLAAAFLALAGALAVRRSRSADLGRRASGRGRPRNLIRFDTLAIAAAPALFVLAAPALLAAATAAVLLVLALKLALDAGWRLLADLRTAALFAAAAPALFLLNTPALLTAPALFILAAPTLFTASALFLLNPAALLAATATFLAATATFLAATAAVFLLDAPPLFSAATTLFTTTTAFLAAAATALLAATALALFTAAPAALFSALASFLLLHGRSAEALREDQRFILRFGLPRAKRRRCRQHRAEYKNGMSRAYD
jgi:hypothetical protein